MKKTFSNSTHTLDNCANLARITVDSWDMKTLLGYAVEQLTVYYQKYEEAFNTDYENEYEDDENFN